MHGSSQSRADPVGLSLLVPVLTSTGFQDDYVLVPQEGGGHCEPSPSIQITPIQLCQKIKATTQDTGLIHEASFCQSLIPSSETPTDFPQISDGDNPFLSEPLINIASNTITKNRGKLVKLYFCL